MLVCRRAKGESLKSLTVVLLAAALALVTPSGPAAAEVIPVQKATPPAASGPTPLQAVGPILSGIVGIGAGAAIAIAVAPVGATYPAALVGGALGAMAGWNIYKTVAGPAMVRAPGPKLAEAPSLLQLAVETRAAD
jgi:hypothetical protein